MKIAGIILIVALAVVMAWLMVTDQGDEQDDD